MMALGRLLQLERWLPWRVFSFTEPLSVDASSKKRLFKYGRPTLRNNILAVDGAGSGNTSGTLADLDSSEAVNYRMLDRYLWT